MNIKRGCEKQRYNLQKIQCRKIAFILTYKGFFNG